jgi:hypothetical protein
MEYYTSDVGKLIANKVVLDLGCSWGFETLFLGLRWKPARIVGVDNYGSDGGVPGNRTRFASNITASGATNVEVLQADAFALPFPTGSVDVILCSQAMHHFFTRTEDLRDLPPATLTPMVTKVRLWRSLLRERGVILIRDTYRYCLRRYADTLRARLRGKRRKVNYETKQQPEAWCYLLKESGFEIQEIKRYVPYALRHWRPFVELRWCNPLVSPFYCVQARSASAVSAVASHTT